MAEMVGIKNIVAARTLLNTSLERSRALAMELDKTGPRLEQIKQRLPSLEAAVTFMRMRKCSFVAVRDQIDGVIGPASAVLNVFYAVRELEKSLLSEALSNLFNYLSIMKQLEEAMKFLADNCRLIIQWLEGILEALEGNPDIDDQYILNVKRPIRILQELQDTDVRARLKGGVLFEALGKLETEFKRLLTKNTVPFALIDSSSSSQAKQANCIAPSLMPVGVIQKLQAIIHRLKANGRFENCISVYVEVRSSNITTSLQVLDLEYLENSITEFDDAHDIEGSIDNWCKHLVLVVKNLFEPEYKFCSDVFDKIGSDVRMSCFAKVAAQSGIHSFLQFGKNVTECKKDPIKLLKLLDIFAVLDNLRVEFNCLFGGEAYGEIQSLTRYVIKRVVNGACEIFWELPLQVELQRKTSPPSNGSVPQLVSFVTDYCNQLLGDKYKPTLTQVLVIHHSWKQEKYQERVFASQVYNIIKEIALNLDAWSSAHHDITLSYLFMMNNHSHFCKLKGTKLGEMMGKSWLRSHEQYKDYYAGLYMRESWGKLLLLLNQKSNTREVIKKRLRAFNEAFDCVYKKQSNWVVNDQSLKETICKLVVQALVPAYRNYLKSYGVLTEEDVSASKHVKYSVLSFENMLSSLFEPKLTKYGSSRQLHFIGKIKDVVTNQFHLMLTAI
ncbi:hypothetical protein JRO89_XS09G0063700 [Xanthoceras sorbifolium]|uniref:Exocyst subunit Exo70 family protein n=1 Tax=Xanthoceras sorbifolium TaxID=99658 RepID=A0ABQ8HKM1_9ROSI|nr:hypothetical protein JRO89_XS09G0063700 [Xanthoceras sorbifolium]